MYRVVGTTLDDLPPEVAEGVRSDETVSELFADGIIDAVVQLPNGIFVAMSFTAHGETASVRAIWPAEVSTQDVLEYFF